MEAKGMLSLNDFLDNEDPTYMWDKLLQFKNY